MPINPEPQISSVERYEVRFTHETGVEMTVVFGMGGFYTEADADQAVQDLLDRVATWDKIDPNTTPYGYKTSTAAYSVTPTA